LGHHSAGHPPRVRDIPLPPVLFGDPRELEESAMIDACPTTASFSE
jgi:hypothetical protein